MTPSTVKDLIRALQQLPPETPIFQMTWMDSGPADMGDWLSVYRKHGVTRLYVDSGEATHPDVDPHCTPLRMP